MAHGYKFSTLPYEFEMQSEVIKDGQFVLDEESGEPKTELRKSTVAVRIHLPLMLCQSQIGAQNQDRDPDFDLYELGVIAKKIEDAFPHIILATDEYERLKKRVKFISKYLNKKFFEMVRRVNEAEKVELKEAEKLESSESKEADGDLPAKRKRPH